MEHKFNSLQNNIMFTININLNIQKHSDPMQVTNCTDLEVWKIMTFDKIWL